jgi:hypothetical protein
MEGGVLVKGGDKDGREGVGGGHSTGEVFSCYGQRAERGWEIGVLRLRHRICWL